MQMQMLYVHLEGALLLTLVNGNSFSRQLQERPPCPPGFYCPLGSLTPLPCPEGTYGPTAGAESVDSCLQCPPHHYCARPGLPAPRACGPGAHQPLSAQGSCTCLGEGQNFQTSDGQCRCTIGYQLFNNGDVCVRKVYDVCRNGRTRTQYGECLDGYQWLLHCREQVCRSAEDYQGYDGELGLCVCAEPPGRVACAGSCRKGPAAQLTLKCLSSREMELVWSHYEQVLSISGSMLETVFKYLDLQRTPLCNCRLSSSYAVHIVQTTDAGFFGLLSGLPKELRPVFPVTAQPYTQSAAGSYSTNMWEATTVDNQGVRDMNSSSSRRATKGEESTNGVLNPTACLQLGDIILFTVDTRHYPQYDLDSLYNTNSDFDWGAFRQLKEEMTLSWTPPSFFSFVFSQPGVYVFKLSSHRHKHLYVRVMPAGVQCFESGPFFPSTPRHVTRLGIRRRRDLLLRPDWLVTGGLLAGAVVILCLCVTLLILFREYGWPEKQPIRARYRSLQSAFHMEDYSSKGSRVASQRKIHRNQQARMSEDSTQPDILDEFWDYEHQVDLEAFSSGTFYNILHKQSLSVTTRLGQLTAEVKELYQGVLGKLQPLHPRVIIEERMGAGHERIRMEVEKEVVRRKTLATQLRNLLDSQLEILRREQQAQQRVFSVFTAQLRESTRLLSKIHDTQPSCELHQQSAIQKLTSLVDEMGERVSAECRRQGAWGLLGEGTGAKLLCDDARTVLGKEHIFGPDGSLRDGLALHCDSLTGLIRPSAHSHMLLSNGHTMAVPPDYFLHPHTGRVLPVAGNVAYDPVSSSLVFTTDLCAGDNRKWESQLIPFIPYPTSRHSDHPLSSPSWLRGLRPGQKLELGFPMADPDTGVPVPILAVTIHPQTGLVYPLGGVHICPLIRLPQPIQIGSPMLESRLGKLVLTVGVSLDPVTGAVLPVGGVLLGESIIEPLSGRMVRVGGASMRAGQLVPNAGGNQALLDSKVLAVMFEVLELLKPLTDQWGSDKTLQHHLGAERESAQHDHLISAAKELQQAWKRSLHCQLQLQSRLRIMLDWAVALQQDGGTLGEMPLPGSDVCVPALLGMEYPDPMGSGLSVPVLGCQTDLSGTEIPLAGTMEDPGGKGLVAIRYGSQTVDPVTEVLAPVVGARLDVSRKKVVPVTSFYWLMMADQTDDIQVEALQREVSARNSHWQQQRQREGDLLSDLDSAVFQCVFREANLSQWCGGQLREAATELQESAQAEAQRRATQCCHLALVLPAHVLNILTLGDGEEWDQHCVWHSELLSGLERLEVSIELLKKEQEKWITRRGDWATTFHVKDRELRLGELWEQWCSRRSDAEAALNELDCVIQLSQLRAETAQAILCGNFWFREYGLVQCSLHRPTVKVTALLQHRALPLLEKLDRLLEEKQLTSFSPSTGNQPVSVNQSAPDSEEERSKLVELSSLFQLLKEVQLQLKAWAGGAGLLRMESSDGSKIQGNSFMDVLDAQWGSEGELIPLDPSDLNPREFLVYQHGQFLMDAMSTLTLSPVVSLQIAAGLPNNNYYSNTFRNSFFYQESRKMLFVRRQRLQSVGGFSLLLLHCLSHITVQDMSSDSSPAFQRLFFRMLQECLGELFQTRLGIPPTGREASLWTLSQDQGRPSGDLQGTLPNCHGASLHHRVHKPIRGLLSEEDVERGSTVKCHFFPISKDV